MKSRLRIIHDAMPSNPREWASEDPHAISLICWHNRYNLGDEHRYDSETFHLELAMEADADLEDRVYDLENRHYQRLIRAGASHEAACALVEARLARYVEKALEGWYIVPIYMYDHSGISLSTGPFSCRWDSGQVGWAVLSPEAAKNYPDPKKAIESEVETYSQYVSGDVWGFVLEEAKTCDTCGHTEWEEVDSCWGFYGSDPAENGIYDNLPQEVLDTCEVIGPW